MKVEILIFIIFNMRDLFLSHEPRNVFPIFKDCENRLSYILRSSDIANFFQTSKFIAKRLIKGKETNESYKFFTRLIYDSIIGIKINFRGYFLNNEGKILCEIKNIASIKYGESFDLSINQILLNNNIKQQNGQFLLIADRGIKLSEQSYTTGTIAAVYSTNNSFTCYRNGVFARPINDFKHHKPRGFRCIVPQIYVSKDIETSAIFMNFSSNPNYDKKASPKMKLYNHLNESIEGSFKTLEPFGSYEQSLTETFGKNVKDFLLSGKGYGTLVAEQDDITLSSIHLIRNHKLNTMGIEHTRPTHMYVI